MRPTSRFSSYIDRMALPAGSRDLDVVREDVIEALGVHFANDAISMEELDRRLTLATSRDVPPRGFIGAFMGGTSRKGAWHVPQHLKVIAIMGGVELDLSVRASRPASPKSKSTRSWAASR